MVQLVRDLFEPATSQVLAIDALDDRRFLLVDDRDRESAADAVTLTLELVAEARPAGDSTIAHAIAQRLARARPDRLQLHLMAGALDERGGLIDRVRELHLLPQSIAFEAGSYKIEAFSRPNGLTMSWLGSAPCDQQLDTERQYKHVQITCETMDTAELRLINPSVLGWGATESMSLYVTRLR